MARDRERIVADGYDAVADEYARLEGEDGWPRTRWLEDLLGRLRPGSRVLDVGCGSGIPAARAIVDRGHAVVGVDVSREQLRRARANVPEAELLLASALDVEFAPESFDAIVALYVVEHMPRERHAQLLARFDRWLRGGGSLLVTFETGDEPGSVGDWLGSPMYFSHFDAATSERLVRDAGLEVVRAEQETQLEGERPVPYLWLLARKPQGFGIRRSRIP